MTSSQFITDMKKCIDCGEWLHLSEFQKSGTSRHGKPMYRAYCKECYKERQKKPNGSPCWTCEHLEECKALLWTLEPLPCYRKVVVTEKTCPQCGTEFVVNHKGRKYCSNYCRHKAAKIRYAEAQGVIVG